MMGRWVIMCVEGTHAGKYVTQVGTKYSYTKATSKARHFNSRVEAEANACGNERVIEI